jgi:hypothetical protein
MTERAGTIRTRTTEKQLVEEGREMPRRRDELAAQKPLRAPRHHTPPDGSNSLGDKRSPVQIRAPRLEERPANRLPLRRSFADVHSTSKRFVFGHRAEIEGVHAPPLFLERAG